MKVWILVCLACINLCVIGSEWKDFGILTQKNIFNPSRGLVITNEVTLALAPSNYFTVVGTLSYEKGAWAFFSGTSEAYYKALKSGDSIAGYRVMSVTNNAVLLSSKTNQIVLKVGERVNLIK